MKVELLLKMHLSVLNSVDNLFKRGIRLLLLSILTFISKDSICQLSFDPPANYRLIGSSVFNNISSGDFNNDGNIDIVVSSASFDSVSVFINKGGGTFDPAKNYAAGRQPSGVSIIDLNNDGHLDIAVANYISNTASIFFGNGTGNFRQQQIFETGDGPQTPLPGDFNEDGLIDFAVANYTSKTIAIFLASNNGSYAKSFSYPVGDSPFADVKDLNKDGHLDIVIVNDIVNGRLNVLLGIGNGEFTSPKSYVTGSYPSCLTYGDFNQDGILDIANGNLNSNTISILIGVGHGSFNEATSFPSVAPSTILTDDYNKDGIVDLAVSNSKDNTVSIYVGNGKGSFGFYQLISVGTNPGIMRLTMCDLNKDGLKDIVSTNNGSDIVSVLLANVPSTPLWRTWWAGITYSLVFVGMLFIGKRVVTKRERKRAQVAIDQKEKEALKKLDTLKTKFFSNITHEFRTPLTLIQGPANELLEKTNDPEAHQLLIMIKNNSERLLRLINQLMDLARLDAHEMKLVNKPIRLETFLKTIISQFTSLAESRGIQFSWNIKGIDDAMLLVDEGKVETVLINLISNALKFTQAGGNVTVNAQLKDDLFEVIVKDNGRGIPPEKLVHIFDRFYQVEATDSSHAEGTGIGLALVKEYVELMKGTVHIDSIVGLGTRVTVSIRLTPAPKTLEQNSQPAAKPTINSIKEQPIEIIESPLLLIVEDDEDIRVFIKTCLGPTYRYTEAKNGREGLEKAIHEIPDIIISDLMMPEMDGLELCREIKKEERTNHIPFIMLTAKAEESDKIEGLQTGADDYLIKPFNKLELTLKIQNLIVLREKLQAHIKNQLLIQGKPVEAHSASEKFIVKAKTFIEAHLAEESLTVETLADEMNLGREQCYRKIVALTGISPSAFIRKLRLQKAAALLSAKWGSVSEVAYAVGFESLSYFSRAFKEEFGKLPSQV